MIMSDHISFIINTECSKECTEMWQKNTVGNHQRKKNRTIEEWTTQKSKVYNTLHQGDPGRKNYVWQLEDKEWAVLTRYCWGGTAKIH